MNATTLQQTEGTPESYPEDPYLDMSDEAAAYLVSAWQRIESYIAWRYSPRDVTWVVEGPGEWVPPLRPATIATVERWTGTAWEAVTLPPSPLGGYCLPDGTFRFAGPAGVAAEVPDIVSEALRRLCEYMAAKPGKPGVRSESVTAGTVSLSTTRSPTAAAEALANSGAADLLRTFRRA